jgi:thiol-disulfide isomerase/thioredoxin
MHLIQKNLLLALLPLVIVGAAQAQDEPAAKPVPLPVAEFQLTEFQGSVVLVDFWASWCEPCRHALPWLNAVQMKYGDQGLQVVMVNLDRDPGAAAKMAADIDAGIRQFLDPTGELATRYELEGMPSSFLYDRSGKLISNHVGFLKADGPKREKAIGAALEREER